MKLFNKEKFKNLSDKKIEEEIIPIHEESGDIIKDRPGLGINQQDQTIIKEHLDLNDKGYEDTLSKEKKYIPISEVPAEWDEWESFEDYIIDYIDWKEPADDHEIYSEDEELRKIEKIDEQKDWTYEGSVVAPAHIHRPENVKKIINKYSMGRDEWNKLSREERTKIKNTIQKEIQELYVHQPKKMVRKDKEKKEKAA